MPKNQVTAVVGKSELSSLFRVLTERQDTDTQIYTKDILVALKDIGAIAAAIDNQLSQYQRLSFTTNAELTFSDNRTKQFNAISELPKFDWERSTITTSITLRWNILIDGSDEEKPREHNIVVRLASGVKPQDFMRAIFSKDLEDMDSFEMASAGCVCHVTFATQSLAGDIFRVVQEWVNGRPTAQYSAPYIRFLRRRSDLIFKLIRHSLPVSAVFAVLAYYCDKTRGFDQDSVASIGFIREAMLYGVILWVTYLVVGFLARWLAGHLHSLLHKVGTLHPFSLTAGDNNRQTELAARNKRHFIRLLFEGGFAVLWNILAAVVILIFTQSAQTNDDEQDGADQPATAPESRLEGKTEPKPESKGLSQ